MIDRITSRETDSEDRNKQRRLDEQAYRQQVDQRAHESKKTRVHFEHRQSERRGEEHEQERAPSERSSGRQAILRATTGLERAGHLLWRGQGPEAHLVLSREAAEARSSARELGRGDPEARVLSALASNMDVRGHAVRAAVPELAKKLAHRMEQIARGTESRAGDLASRGHSNDAQLLRDVATDSRLQAGLVRAGADNLDALIGRALARVLAGLVKEGSPKSELALDRALRDLDTAIDEQRVPLHRILEEAQRGKKKGSVDCERTVSVLRKNERAKPLLDGLRDLSIAISRGDPRAASDARGKILEDLHRTGQLPQLDRVLAGLPASRVTSDAAELLERMLPRLLLDGVKNGTIKELAKNGGLEPFLRSLAPMSNGLRTLLPGERALASHGTLMAAASLGPIEALLLGSPSLFSAQGTVSNYLSARGLETIPTSFAGEPINLMMLPPAARHESAVLLAPDGALMVRSDEGPVFFHGHLIGADEQRYYYNTVPLDDELRRVTYQSAADPAHRHVRVDMGVDVILDERDEGEQTPSRSKKRRDDLDEGESSENLVAVAIFTGEPEPSIGFTGFATRVAARKAQGELERINEGLIEDARIGHLYLDYAADCGLRLAAMGYPNTDAFQAHLDRALEDQGFSNELVGALVLIDPEAGCIRNVERLDPSDPEGLQESFLLYPTSVTID